MKKLVLGLLLLVVVYSCGKSAENKLSSVQLREIELSTARDRVEKDTYFASNESPFADSLKALFHGLYYYAFDSTYVLRTTLQVYHSPRELNMTTSKGKIKHYTEYGFFEFDLNGPQKLNVYRPKPALEGHANYLFVPFKDATNGSDTYSAGRYIELILNDSADGYVLDFNSAYNPWCAYSDNYNCPYPPKENHLPIPVYAGEKKFRLREH